VFGGHVFVIEGEHVTALGEAAKGRQIIMTAHYHIGGYQSCGIGRPGGQHPQGLP